MATCSGCGARIDWVNTRGGKKMPVDPTPVMIRTNSNKKDTVIVTAGGDVIKGQEVLRGVDVGKVHTDANYAVGRISHFATCPKASNFKKK